jgi:hypothetical protein
MSRRRIWKKHEAAAPQKAPSYQKLLEKYESGLRSQKEISRRLLAGRPTDEAEAQAFDSLKIIAIDNGWIEE